MEGSGMVAYLKDTLLEGGDLLLGLDLVPGEGLLHHLAVG